MLGVYNLLTMGRFICLINCLGWACAPLSFYKIQSHIEDRLLYPNVSCDSHSSFFHCFHIPTCPRALGWSGDLIVCILRSRLSILFGSKIYSNLFSSFSRFCIEQNLVKIGSLSVCLSQALFSGGVIPIDVKFGGKVGTLNVHICNE